MASTLRPFSNGTQLSLANVSNVLVPTLSQNYTNGLSVLGTLDAPKLPQFADGPTNNGYPWGTRNTTNANPVYPPDTGVTRYYSFELTNGTIAPDGVELPALLINNAYPGPLITANWGDWIEVQFTNSLPQDTEGSSLHWHGLIQRETPWFDGVPGVTQCPVAPGSTFTYRFRADQYGTTWWHSHYSAQYVGAVLGPLIIYGPSQVDYDIDLGPIMMNDWVHSYYFPLVQNTMAPHGYGKAVFFSLDNILINGKNNYDCTMTNLTCTDGAGLSKFQFQSGKKHRLRLINSGGEAIIKFGIDNHKLTVIANDFVPVEPYTVDIVSLVVGQRTDIIVEATGKPTDVVWMRAFTSSLCSAIGPDYITALGAIYYENASTNARPTTNTTAEQKTLDVCNQDPLGAQVPMYVQTPDPNPDVTLVVDCWLGNNGTHNVWYMNGISFQVDYNDPLLLEAKLGNLTFPEMANVHNFGTNTSVRLVVYNHFLLASHPMHLHGHNFYVLAEGYGTWNGSGIVNPQNPQRRDTYNVQKSIANATTNATNDYQGLPAYVVLQYEQDNPGVWPFHCHIAWHVSDGFAMTFLERPDDIKNELSVPGVMAQTCRDWSAWTGDHVVDQIDDGL